MPGENSRRILVFIRPVRRRRKSKRRRVKEDGTRWRLEGKERKRTTAFAEPKYPSFVSSSGVGRERSLSLAPPFLSVLSAEPPIIIIFYHNICFSHILFYVNGRCQPPFARLVLASFSRWFPLRMHGLGELLAFCLEFKKFFRRTPRPCPLPFPSSSASPSPRSSRSRPLPFPGLPFSTPPTPVP